MPKKGFFTTNLHSDREDSPEHGVLHKAIHPSVAYGYEDARHLAEVFQGKRDGYNYGRQLNPTVTALQKRITNCLLYTSPSPRDLSTSRMPSSA